MTLRAALAILVLLASPAFAQVTSHLPKTRTNRRPARLESRMILDTILALAATTSATFTLPPPKPFLFAQGFGGGGEHCFAADLDGDGYADFICVPGRAEGEVWVVRNEIGQKAHGAEKWADAVATADEPCAVGDFDGNHRADIAVIAKDGTIRLVLGDGATCRKIEKAGVSPVAGHVRLLAADAEGRRISDLYVLVAEGRAAEEVFLLKSDGHGAFEPARLLGRAPAHAFAGDFTGDGKADLIWIEDGNLMLARGNGTEPLSPPIAVEVANAPGPIGKILACGDITGGHQEELAVPGGWVHFEKGGAKAVFWEDARLLDRPGAAYAMADIDGDGNADFITFTRRDRSDVIVALSRWPGWYDGAPPLSKDWDGDGLTDFEEIFVYHTDPCDRDTDGDGLLDGWEVKGFRGVPLGRMGANPLHKDIFLELDVEVGADMPRVERAIARMNELYASAPVDNPDGRRGITMHCEVDTRVPIWEKEAPGRQELRELFFTPNRAGLFHWMHLAARGGGGQADMLADQGSCAGVFECTLPHEFGHQMGLNHGGADGMNGIPIYPSLMNYAYNYVLPQYSSGALAGLALDENALPERIEVPFEQLKYLAGPPFHFKMEPRDGGKACWIDWNRNGREDSGPVRENINAAAGEGYGRRDILDKSASLPEGKTTRTCEQPALVTVPASKDRPETLVLLYVPREGGGLALRVLEEDNWAKWGPEIRMAEAPADLHDISAAAQGGGHGVVVYGTSGKDVVRIALARGANGWAAESVHPQGWEGIPAVAVNGIHELVVLRAADGKLVGKGDETYAIEGITSSVPAALAMDTVKHELLMATSDLTSDRMRLTRLDPANFKVISTEPVGGEKGGDATNQRAAILFETAPWLEPEGRVDIFVAGKFDLKNPDPNSCTHLFRCYTIGDKEWLGRAGWKCDMTWNEWTYTLSGVGAAWFHGRPWHASRFFTIPVWDPQGVKDSMCIADQADGVCDSGLKDCNDWEIISGIGLQRSILQTWTPRGKR